MEAMEVREEPEIGGLMEIFSLFFPSIWQSGGTDKPVEIMKRNHIFWRFNASDIFIYSLSRAYGMFKLQFNLDEVAAGLQDNRVWSFDRS